MAATAQPQIPAGPRYPRALQTLGWARRPLPFMERCQQRYGDVFTLRVAQEGTWVFLAHPDAIQQVFKGDPRLLHAGEGNRILLPIVGHHSVLLLDEQEHMAQRKLMLPSFHGERMRRYDEIIREIAREEIERWPLGQAVEARERMQAITLEVIMRVVFGFAEGERLDRLRTLLREALEWTADPKRMVMVALLGPDRVTSLRSLRRALDPVDELLVAEIHERREATDLAEREDILSMLLTARHEDGSAMTDQELRDELMTLLVAGHETTATALAWALERLVRHPDKLQRLRDEVAAGEDEYLEAVVKETLRLRPILPLVARRLTAPMEIGGHLLPAGVRVTPCIYLVHRRPDVYPEPRRFRPERFLEQPAGTYTWIPFGGGVRRCLGASFAMFEMKAVLSQVVASRALAPAVAASERVSRRAITLIPQYGGQIVPSALAADARPAAVPEPANDRTAQPA
jgi:cytochrome P450